MNLQKNIIYGPVKSRRLGCSLGVNLLSNRLKLCSLNCCYCQYGWTSKLIKSGKGYSEFFPSVQEVILALKDVFLNGNNFDYITFSGNGEPTLHPDFPEIIALVSQMKAYFRSDARLAILSNSTTCSNPELREALDKIDLPIMKLDVGNERAFHRINHGGSEVSFHSVVDGIKSMRRFVIQTMFVRGAVDNSTDIEVDSWIKTIHELNPLWIQIYTLDRAPAGEMLRKVTQPRLKQIAQRAEKKTGISIEVYDEKKSKGKNGSLEYERLLN